MCIAVHLRQLWRFHQQFLSWKSKISQPLLRLFSFKDGDWKITRSTLLDIKITSTMARKFLKLRQTSHSKTQNAQLKDGYFQYLL
jgi:hypothetical protein